MKTVRIRNEVAGLICECARNAYPNEFGAMLRMENGVISDVLFYPRSITGEESFSVYDWDVPMGLDYCGTVHSHPSGSNRPSREDLDFFSGRKEVHLIIKYPFGREDIAAYGSDGKKMEIIFV